MATSPIQNGKADGASVRGARDYLRDAGRYPNPAPLGSDAFNKYERGWMQSLKKDDAKLIVASNHTNAPTVRSIQTNSVNAYADLNSRTALGVTLAVLPRK